MIPGNTGNQTRCANKFDSQVVLRRFLNARKHVLRDQLLSVPHYGVGSLTAEIKFIELSFLLNLNLNLSN